jgi:hypothetical protein
MLSLLRRLIFLLVFLVVVTFIFRNWILIHGFGYALNNATGFSLRAESCDFSRFVPPVIFASNLTVENPDDFDVPNALDISQAEIRFPKDFWNQLDRARIEKLSLTIKEFSIVRNATGRVNVMLIEELAKAKPGRIRSYPLIGELELSIDKVSFYDSFGLGNNSRPTPVTVRVDLQEVRYKNVQNATQLERLIIREALKKTRFKGLESEYIALGLQ